VNYSLQFSPSCSPLSSFSFLVLPGCLLLAIQLWKWVPSNSCSLDRRCLMAVNTDMEGPFRHHWMNFPVRTQLSSHSIFHSSSEYHLLQHSYFLFHWQRHLSTCPSFANDLLLTCQQPKSYRRPLKCFSGTAMAFKEGSDSVVDFRPLCNPQRQKIFYNPQKIITTCLV
jgi:hypothetical protein